MLAVFLCIFLFVSLASWRHYNDGLVYLFRSTGNRPWSTFDNEILSFLPWVLSIAASIRWVQYKYFAGNGYGNLLNKCTIQLPAKCWKQLLLFYRLISQTVNIKHMPFSWVHAFVVHDIQRFNLAHFVSICIKWLCRI